MENAQIPALEQVKNFFKNHVNGFDANEHPADFAAFLFLKQQEKIKEAIKAIDNVKSKETITPVELRTILEKLLLQ